MPARVEASSDATPKTPRVWRYGRLLLLMLAIAHQAFDQAAFPGFGLDKCQQIAAGRSLWEGKGLAVWRFDPRSPRSPHLSANRGWPPGYSFAVGPWLVARWGPARAALVVDWLSTVVFFVSWFALLETTGKAIDWRARAGFWFYWAFVFPPLGILTSSDVLAVALFSLGLFCGARALTKSGSRDRRLVWSVASGIFLGTSATVRFAYWPLVAVGPIAQALVGIRRDRTWVRDAFATAGTSAIIVAGTALFQKLESGATTYLHDLHQADSRGWFWSQLREFSPFPAGGIGLDVALDRAGEWLRLPSWVAEIATWSICGLMLFVAWRASRSAFSRGFLSRSQSEESPIWAYLTIAFWSTAFLIVGILGYFTVRFRAINGWVYAEELRYYSPLFGFLSLSLWKLAFPRGGSEPRERESSSSTHRGPWAIVRRDGLRILVVGLLFLAVVLVGVQRARRWWRWREGTYPIDANTAVFDENAKTISRLVAKTRMHNRPVVWIDERLARYGVTMTEGAACANFEEARSADWSQAGPAVVFVAVDGGEGGGFPDAGLAPDDAVHRIVTDTCVVWVFPASDASDSLGDSPIETGDSP